MPVRRTWIRLNLVVALLVLGGFLAGASWEASRHDEGPPVLRPVGLEDAASPPTSPGATEGKSGDGTSGGVTTTSHSADDPSGTDAATPARIIIPAIDVDATVVPVGLQEDGAMEVPDFGLAGWYDLGPTPGAPGPAVIAAHVDSYEGPDVFYLLRDLSVGDVIEVHGEDGSVTRFVTEHTEMTDKDELPVDQIWNDTGQSVLRLITCGGEFDRAARSYRSNVVVYASKAPAH